MSFGQEVKDFVSAYRGVSAANESNARAAKTNKENALIPDVQEYESESPYYNADRDGGADRHGWLWHMGNIFNPHVKNTPATAPYDAPYPTQAIPTDDGG